MKSKSVLLVALFLSVFFWPKTSWSQAPQAQKTQLTINEPLSFTIPSGCGREVKFSLWLFSKDGDLKNLNAQVLAAKAPDGSAISLDKINLTKKSDTVTQAGTELILSLTAANLLRAGEYAFTLLLDGTPPQVPPLQKVITLKQPAATLNLDELKDRTFKLTRSFPWCSAQGQFPFFLHDANLAIAIHDLQAFGQEVFLDQTRIQVPGILDIIPSAKSFILYSPRPACGERVRERGHSAKTFGNSSNPPDSACLGQNQQITLALAFSQFDQTGTFSSSILLTSPSFDKPVRIPLKIEVTDWWLLPLLVIQLGVLLGFIVGFLKKTYQPRQRSLLRLSRLRAVVVRQTSLTQDPVKRQTLFTISQKIDAASAKILDDAFAGAAADLDEAQKALDEFLLQSLQEKLQTRRDVESLLRQLKAAHPALDPAEQKQLADIQSKLEQALYFLSREEVEPARAMLQNCQKEYDTFRETLLTADLRKLEQEIALLPQADQDHLTPLVTEVTGLIGKKDFDAAAVKLAALKREVHSKAKKTTTLALKSIQPQPPQPHVIEVENGSANRTSGTKISFTFHPEALKKLFPDDYDAMEWHFGDGSDTAGPFKKQTAVQHVFAASGTYSVEIQLLKDGLPIPGGAFSRLVEIRPGKNEMSEAGFLKNIRAANWGITVAALLLAAITGLLYLYLGKPFGTIKDYLLALLWGFGINEGVKGFTEVYGKITA